jgi:alpha-beta hydrolase superfamily lysophospholipase
VFLELGFDALLVDFRGSGGSEGAVTTLGHDEALDVAAAVKLAESLEAVRPMILFGYSMGSVGVMRAVAESGVRPDAIILEGSFSTLLQAVKNRFTLMGLPSFPAAHLLVFWGGAQHGFNGFKLSALDYARKVACPVLLLHGASDRRSTVEEARALSNAVAGPATLHVFEGSGHASEASRQPARWRGAVASFLTSAVSSSSRGARRE